ncbi:hypothetical protein DCC81_04345 [Chitinophaga parva]|uniref:Uncharacterized protein n=1 Tax=Chitinophaga parva TaxID=2169414 RepID=A0A2T7BM73_9BACT|nr:hypothetical protein DCC81_04345 [Chitinophaga parva]
MEVRPLFYAGVECFLADRLLHAPQCDGHGKYGIAKENKALPFKGAVGTSGLVLWHAHGYLNP